MLALKGFAKLYKLLWNLPFFGNNFLLLKALDFAIFPVLLLLMNVYFYFFGKYFVNIANKFLGRVSFVGLI